MIHRLLIANRGEIAVRVARTARERGIATVAVYSEADRGARHVRACDRAVEIGPPPAEASYLNAEAILEAARKTGADAVHPGYGFLSEDPGFAEAVIRAGLIWVGPPPEAMRAMGDKVPSRQLMERAGIPVVPGFDRTEASEEEFAAAAARIGYPVLVKASAGGGGKGMRRVDRAEDLPAALAAGRREATAAFGNGSVYLEKAIENPRHVEIQIFGDAAGKVYPLFERECSVQRRHQKIVEETPSPFLDETTRSRMGEAAVAAAAAVKYAGAGTVEFLIDAQRRFYFLEMNTRLQVEHPITEETLGIDLVAAQLEVAGGGRLPEEWRRLRPRGHAIEARLYAEDPATYLPRAGTVRAYEEPQGPGIRVDSGIENGSRVGIEYDPILAKVIVHAADRVAAVARMRRALTDYVVLGVTTNLPLLQRVLGSPDFGEGRTDTGILSRLPPQPLEDPPPAALIAAAHAAAARAPEGETAGAKRAFRDPWASGAGRFP